MTKTEGRAILKKIKQKGLTVVSIAKHLKVSRWTIYSVLTGHSVSARVEAYLREITKES